MNNSKINYVKDTFEEYLGKPDHVSASDLKNFMQSPKTYYYDKFEKPKDDKERHFAIGSALHEIILEPELFNSNYIISPKFDRRTTDGKANYAAFEKLAEGKTVLNVDEMEIVRKVGESALKNKTLLELMKDSYREISCYTVDEKTGLLIRVRPDSLASKKSTVTDLKSCLNSSAKNFKKDVYNYEYSLSAAFYMDFLNRENYIFAALEKQAPYQVSLYALNDEMIEYGRKQYRTGLDLLKWSKDNNYWCDYMEFEILKECYELENLDGFFETLETSELIRILN